MKDDLIIPCDWDMESRCTVDGCNQPATHSLLSRIADDVPVFEMVCCMHARVE